MRLSFLSYGALRSSNRYCYRAHVHTYNRITLDQRALVKAHFPQATNALSRLHFGGQKLHYNTLGNGVPSRRESANQYKGYSEAEFESNDGFQDSQKQAFSNRTFCLPENLAGSTAAETSRRRVWDALQRRQPHELFPAFLDASQDPEYMKSLRTTTFIEILELLHPIHFVGTFKKLYRDFHPSQVEHLGMSQLHDIFAEYTTKMREIVRQWLHARGDSGIEEWRSLLQLVAYVGDGAAALEIWTGMVNRKIEPDLACYNLYFEARCWSGAYFPLERHRLRVIPKNLQLRQLRKAGSGHLQRLRGFQTGPGGLRDEVTRMFAVMVNRGIVGDARTFGLLVTALSREGDLQGVKSVMKKVWDVDVDNILKGDSDPGKPTILACGSPLYPSSTTLHTIAHIFGSNNELPTALRIVDYVSRRYSITINPQVWDELLEWAHVLSSRRRAVRGSDGAAYGQLPLKSIESLWNTMVSAPYNIRPSMRMYNHYCSNLFKRQMLHEMLRQMRAGLALYRSQATCYEELRRLNSLTSAQSPEQHSWRNLISIGSSNQEEALGALTEYRNFLMISRWFRLLLGGTRWGGGLDRIVIWQRQELPNAVREFWHFRPRPVIRYRIATGEIEIAANEDKDHVTRPAQQGFVGSHFRKFNMRPKRKFLRARRCTGSQRLFGVQPRYLSHQTNFYGQTRVELS